MRTINRHPSTSTLRWAPSLESAEDLKRKLEEYARKLKDNKLEQGEHDNAFFVAVVKNAFGDTISAAHCNRVEINGDRITMQVTYEVKHFDTPEHLQQWRDATFVYSVRADGRFAREVSVANGETVKVKPECFKGRPMKIQSIANFMAAAMRT